MQSKGLLALIRSKARVNVGRCTLSRPYLHTIYTIHTTFTMITCTSPGSFCSVLLLQDLSTVPGQCTPSCTTRKDDRWPSGLSRDGYDIQDKEASTSPPSNSLLLNRLPCRVHHPVRHALFCVMVNSFLAHSPEKQQRILHGRAWKDLTHKSFRNLVPGVWRATRAPLLTASTPQQTSHSPPLLSGRPPAPAGAQPSQPFPPPLFQYAAAQPSFRSPPVPSSTGIRWWEISYGRPETEMEILRSWCDISDELEWDQRLRAKHLMRILTHVHAHGSVYLSSICSSPSLCISSTLLSHNNQTPSTFLRDSGMFMLEQPGGDDAEVTVSLRSSYMQAVIENRDRDRGELRDGGGRREYKRKRRD